MEFYSNGKLWVIGEYYVLEGAKVLAWPTKAGQYLRIYPLQSPVLTWKSYDADGSVWYNDDIQVEDILQKKTIPGHKIRNTLLTILYEAHLLNPSILSDTPGFLVETELTFPKNWGLGSSSTLINNIAQWFQVDAFELLEKSFGGSGFDIACAQHNQAVTYQKKGATITVEEVDFYPDFKNDIYFIYLNQKKDSKEGIATFKKKKANLTTEIEEVSRLTDELVKGVDYITFIARIQDYELKLSKILEIPTVQESLFPDFEGTIKSLGAWGGDFIMAVSKDNPEDYFVSKGFTVVIPFRDMIL